MMDSRFRPKQIYEQVADQIRAAIGSGAYPAGSRLPSERDLAQRLNVSRPAVREAIGSLQNAGLVITRHGSGTYVTGARDAPADAARPIPAAARPVPAADISPISILRARLIIEPAVARLAAQRGQRDAQAEHHLESMAQVQDITDPHQQQLWSESDRLFHRQIAVMTGDPLLISIADELADSMNQPLWHRLRDDGIYDAARIRLYVAEHQLIYEAIVSGDADAAAFYVEGHLRRVERDIATRE